MQGVGEELPFTDKKFDGVVSKWAIQTSFDVPQLLREATRVLKVGGMLVFLTKHPMMQWKEKVRDNGHPSDYFKQSIVTSNIYDGTIVLKEPSHTMGEYLSPEFLSNFELLSYQEYSEFPASEQIDGDTFPTFFIVVARRKLE